MFPEVCFRELSYVNVPAVNLKLHSMNVANHTLLRRIIFRTNITRTYYMYQLLGVINQQAAVRHVSKMLLLRLVLATYCIDKRQLSDLLSLSVVRTTRNVYQMKFKCYQVTT